MVEPTNKQAGSEGADTRTYKDWAPFNVSEIYKMCGMLCLNAIPQATVQVLFLHQWQE